MVLYGVSGLGADERVFQYLTLDCKIEPVNWIDPVRHESIADYSRRLASQIDDTEEFGIIGVSFGGLIAIELSKILIPRLTILVSFVQVSSDLRLVYRIIGKSNLLNLLPAMLFDPPRKPAAWLFGARNKLLLRQILDDTDLSFAKWAVGQLVKWENEDRLANSVLLISGSADKLMPLRKVSNQVVIDGGEHFMIVDKARMISRVINDELQN